MEEAKYCGRCGAKLIRTNLNMWFCSNCGQLPDNQDDFESNGGETFYVG